MANDIFITLDWLDVCLPLPPLVEEEIYTPTPQDIEEFNRTKNKQ